jgi:Mrp family chromosome partitioning ATPase
VSTDAPRLSVAEAGGRQPVVIEVRLREDAPVVLHSDPPSMAAEQYRALAVQIEDRIAAARTEAGYLLAITSAEERAGKTLSALNVALTLARGGERRVLLVEADIWREGLRPYFRTSWPRERGLVQVLDGTVKLPQAVVRIGGTGLDLLPSGSVAKIGNVMTGGHLTELFRELRSSYEIVVLDTPPLPLLASARAVAGRADGAVIVVRAGQSRRSGVEHAVDALGAIKIVGLLLNGARVRYQDYY